MVHLRSGPRFGLGKFFSVIVTSSDMDKKLEIDKKISVINSKLTKISKLNSNFTNISKIT